MLRADFGPIVVRRGANIQDGSVLHGGDDPVTEIGEGATVGHLCVVHGAVIGTEALVGNGTTVLDGVVVGRRALIASGATVPPGMVVPDGMIAVGVPARVAGEVTGRAKEWVDTNPAIYRELARRHASGARLVGSEPWNIARPPVARRPDPACPHLQGYPVPRPLPRVTRPPTAPRLCCRAPRTPHAGEWPSRPAGGPSRHPPVRPRFGALRSSGPRLSFAPKPCPELAAANPRNYLISPAWARPGRV